MGTVQLARDVEEPNEDNVDAYETQEEEGKGEGFQIAFVKVKQSVALSSLLFFVFSFPLTVGCVPAL